MSYERLNLKTGQVITEEVFAHLEDGIEGAANAVLMTPILYADLVALRDAGQLKAGMFYRITDYVTTTIQENTQSAGHAFDVIVMATDSKTLSEEARAIVHEGDTYFTEAGANLAAWKVWYALDNDSARFAWADAENGKGVIYRLIDEWNNDCPYDFKNVMYQNTSEDRMEFTFSLLSSGSISDLSILGTMCRNNMICQYKVSSLLNLNRIIFVVNSTSESNACYNNTFGNGCHDNTFGNGCRDNTFGNGCYNNTFGYGCLDNTFGNGCYNNTFGNSTVDNMFGRRCNNNIFGDFFTQNTFGNNNSAFAFGNGCSKNRVGNMNAVIIFGDGCSQNIIGDKCSNCGFLSYFSSKTPANYAQFCNFGNFVSMYIVNDATASGNSQIQNYVFADGIAKNTVDGTRGNLYETYLGINSAGSLKAFNLADLAN